MAEIHKINQLSPENESNIEFSTVAKIRNVFNA